MDAMAKVGTPLTSCLSFAICACQVLCGRKSTWMCLALTCTSTLAQLAPAAPTYMESSRSSTAELKPSHPALQCHPVDAVSCCSLGLRCCLICCKAQKSLAFGPA